MMMLAPPSTAHGVLFAGATADPAAGLAVDLGDQLDGDLPATVGGAVRRTVARDVADAAMGFTHLDLTEVLAAGWQKHTLLRAAGRRTLDAPGTRETVVLEEHRISHEAHPYVDVLLGEARVTRVTLTLVVSVDVTALAASVSAGRLTRLTSGRAVFTAALDIAGAPLTRHSKEVQLPLALDLGQGLRLA